jgi:hypothetical protein
MFNAASTFDASRGKYIALLEGDDCWLHPQKLRVQVEQLESDPGAAASCHYALAVEEGRPWLGSVTPEFAGNSFSLEAILRRDTTNVHTSTWLLRRGKPMEWAGFESSSFGDYPVIVWTLLNGTGRLLPHVWSLYRRHGGGVFSPLAYETRVQRTVQLWKCFKSIVPGNLQWAADVGICRTLIMHTRELRKAGKWAEALACCRSALAQIPGLKVPAAELGQLRREALEAFVMPRLHGLRSRWRQRKFQR